MFGLGDKEKKNRNTEEQKSMDNFLETAKKRFIEIYLEAKKINDWRSFTPKALEFFEWFKNNAPFTPDEMEKIFPPKEILADKGILTPQEKKKRKHWFKWKNK